MRCLDLILWQSLFVLSALGAASTVAGNTFWMENIKRQGSVAFGGNPSYTIYRNVKNYGAKGDGSTDDTAAINHAISDGNRCGLHCNSSTVTPALVYFPSGTYMVSSPIVMYFYSQLVGDVNNLPVLKAKSNFNGMAVLDSDVYIPGGYGAEWYDDTDNFYRQVRNFVIDITAMPSTGQANGIHWQVSQATSLQNIRFNMQQGGVSNNQIGIFMDNGSGGWMSDLVFEGGKYGAFLGNQQFTSRNLTFNGCQTAIYMNWNWLWTFKSLTITNVNIGIDMSNGGVNAQTVGSVIILDSQISANAAGILTNFSPAKSKPPTGGTLYIDNVDFTGSKNAVSNSGGRTILSGGKLVASFAQGNAYTTGKDNITTQSAAGRSCSSKPSSKEAIAAQGSTVQHVLAPVSKPGTLLGSGGRVFERSKPQYNTLDASSFLSAKTYGCKGDGIQDDTNCIQNFFNKAASLNQIAYIDHGAYVITTTVQVPLQSRIVGEIWPMFMASGFTDQNNPRPMFRVGNPGDVGAVEMQDIIFETLGPNPGSILVEWNLAQSSAGSAAMWDVHWRIGGTAGSQLQSNVCSRNPKIQLPAKSCEGAFLLLHVTSKAAIYMENTWLWVADHDLDLEGNNQITIFNGRGALIESSNGPVWMYGSSSEHSVLYNYQFFRNTDQFWISHASNVWMGAIQSETAYFQPYPNALQPFKAQSAYTDPTFPAGSSCSSSACYKTWGLRIVNSSKVFTSGAGLYSFFDNYDQTCDSGSCQENIVEVSNSSGVHLWGLSTKAAANMVTLDGQGVVLQDSGGLNNTSNFCDTIALFEKPGAC